jgi:hypothetical protein
MDHVENLSSNENDYYLGANHNKVNSQEKPVARNSLKYVKFIIKTAITEIISMM